MPKHSYSCNLRQAWHYLLSLFRVQPQQKVYGWYKDYQLISQTHNKSWEFPSGKSRYDDDINNDIGSLFDPKIPYQQLNY